MSGQTHDLKAWPVYFQRVWEGDKTFEVRLDDRGYQKGDLVVLREWDHRGTCTCADNGRTKEQHRDLGCERYSGRTITARIGFVMASTPPRGSQRGFVGMGYVVFSLVEPKQHDGRAPTAPAAVTTNNATPTIVITSPPPVGPAEVALRIDAARRARS